MSAFIHLHLHTEYSIVDGLCQIKPLIEAAKRFKMPALAITDQNNFFGLVQFYSKAYAAGIKPILGADVWVRHPEEADISRVVLLCQNQQGYKNVTRLISRGYLEGQQLGVPILQQAWLQEAAEGIIILSGGCQGDVAKALLAENSELAKKRLQFWQEYFPDRYYLELVRTGRVLEEEYIHSAIDLAVEQGLPVVATNDVRFIHPEDFEAHEARVCIHEGQTLSDDKRARNYSEQQYLRSSAEMGDLFADIPEALANSVEIARRCTVELTLGKPFLPKFPIPMELTPEAYLAKIAEEGLEKRWAILQKTALPHLANKQLYTDRLHLELKVINDMGFAGYFLIVADFIRWAKENGIPVGPGRGSGAGSLVAYATYITDLDPLAYDLLFERFLNPERVSMPDFDIDFCMDGRDRVIDYVASRYGRQSVSQIITFGTMAAKAVVRDVGRVLGHPYGFVDKIAKLIPFELGITLEKALEDEPNLREWYESDEEVRELIELAKKLEGITRNAGKHAGGVVIAPGLLTDFTPIYCEEGSTQLVSQFDKDDVEAVGLVKFDFLGLRTLTIIDWAVQTINAIRGTSEEPLDISLIPLNDPKTFELLKACSTTAVFQLESRGMKDLIKRLQPDCFEDIIALVALFRPGPLQSGMVDDFINRKHGRAKVEYPHPKLEPILRPTYGVILYQEQVMQIAQVLAGYSLGNADLLRRAMGKKKAEEMAQQRQTFTEGAVKSGVPEATATYIFDLMEKFAGYGFNKSHSAAYALVSYQTAWLKAHFKAAFMAAVLSSDMDNTDKVVGFIDECHELSITILPPDINSSHYKFRAQGTQHILYGLGAIKGVGAAALESIISNREQQGVFKDLFDFCNRVDLRKVNRRVLEALIRAGAFDKLGVERSTLLATLDNAIKYAEQQGKNAALGQGDLFASLIVAEAEPHHYIDAPPLSSEERLAGEKATVGLYLSGHPLDHCARELSHFTTCPIGRLKNVVEKQQVVIAGLVHAIRIIKTKQGKKMVIVTLEDKTGCVEMTVFADDYEKSQTLLQKDMLVIAEGEVSLDHYTGNQRLRAKRLMDMQTARSQYAKGLQLTLVSQAPAVAEQLRQILAPYVQGNCPVRIRYQTAGAAARISLPPTWAVTLADSLLSELRSWLGATAVNVVY